MNAARTGRLHIIALADHDTIGGVREAQAAATGSVHVIPALEISTFNDRSELHMLGYFIDLLNPTLIGFGERASGRREERMRDMIELLGRLGVHVAYADVVAAAGPRHESIGRPHLARVLVQRGHVPNMGEAFDRYIGDEGPAFVPTRLITPSDAIDLIHQAGGVAVWAHPRHDVLEPMLPRLREAGLDGVECYRPRLSITDTDRIAAAAAAHGLFVTGGSDWHGEWHGPLGDFALERDDVADFLEIGGI